MKSMRSFFCIAMSFFVLNLLFLSSCQQQTKEPADYAVVYNDNGNLKSENPKVYVHYYTKEGDLSYTEEMDGFVLHITEEENQVYLSGSVGTILHYDKENQKWNNIQLPVSSAYEFIAHNGEYAVVENGGYSDERMQRYHSRAVLYNEEAEELLCVERLNSEEQIMDVDFTEEFLYIITDDLNNQNATSYLYQIDRKDQTETKKELGASYTIHGMVRYQDDVWYLSDTEWINARTETAYTLPERIVERLYDDDYVCNIYTDGTYLYLAIVTILKEDWFELYKLQPKGKELVAEAVLSEEKDVRDVIQENDGDFLLIFRERVETEEADDVLSFYEVDHEDFQLQQLPLENVPHSVDKNNTYAAGFSLSEK